MTNEELIADARAVYASGDFLTEAEVLKLVDALESARTLALEEAAVAVTNYSNASSVIRDLVTAPIPRASEEYVEDE